MPYSPPAGNAVNFVRDQAAYTPPLGDHADFHGYTEASYVITGNGRFVFSGEMTTYAAPIALCTGPLLFDGAAVTGHGIAGDAYGDFAFSGMADVEIVIPTINALGGVNWGGGIDVTVVVNSLCGGSIEFNGAADLFTRPPQIDIECYGGLTPLFGIAEVQRGVNVACAGRYAFGGSAVVRNGRVATASGALRFAGSASVHRGVAASCSGGMLFTGVADMRAGTSVYCVANGQLAFSGEAYVYIDREAVEAVDSIFVMSIQEKIHVAVG